MLIDYTIVIPHRVGTERIPVRGEFLDIEHFGRRRKFEENRGYSVECVKILTPPAGGIAIGGEALPTTLWQLEQRASVLLADEQARPLPDNALISFICDAVRLARENEKLAMRPIPIPPADGGEGAK